METQGNELVGIGEAARRLSCSPSWLRKLEAKGVIQPARRIAGHDRRVYDAQELQQLQAIFEARRARRRQAAAA